MTQAPTASSKRNQGAEALVPSSARKASTSGLLNWKIKNWQRHQQHLRRKQALASQGVELNHCQRPNRDIIRVQQAEERAMRSLQSGFRERSLDELQAIVRRRLFSYVKGGHFELGKTWKRIRQAGGGHSNTINVEEFATAIGDLGFSDAEIKKLFDHWDMDGSGGIDFYEFAHYVMGDDMEPIMQKDGSLVQPEPHLQKIPEPPHQA